jgi:hypothetical protein
MKGWQLKKRNADLERELHSGADRVRSIGSTAHPSHVQQHHMALCQLSKPLDVFDNCGVSRCAVQA